MYTQFAQVYDQLMADMNYPAWAAYYMSLLRLSGASPKTLCECACGTGSMTVELARFVPRVIASDLSPDMLEQASIKARKSGLFIPFVMQDMRKLHLHKPVDAIICPCDGINYLLTERDIQSFFTAAFQNLTPGGVLAFDLSTEEKLFGMCDAPYFEDLEDLTYLWQNQWDDRVRTILMDLCFFVKQSNGLYARFDEHQVQRAHAPGSIISALTQAGFQNIRAFGDRTLTPPVPGELRNHYVATKPAIENT